MRHCKSRRMEAVSKARFSHHGRISRRIRRAVLHNGKRLEEGNYGRIYKLSSRRRLCACKADIRMVAQRKHHRFSRLGRVTVGSFQRKTLFGNRGFTKLRAYPALSRTWSLLKSGRLAKIGNRTRHKIQEKHNSHHGGRFWISQSIALFHAGFAILQRSANQSRILWRVHGQVDFDVARH